MALAVLPPLVLAPPRDAERSSVLRLGRGGAVAAHGGMERAAAPHVEGELGCPEPQADEQAVRHPGRRELA